MRFVENLVEVDNVAVIPKLLIPQSESNHCKGET
jgi:hypothetical protein